jgi:REP-associated tyrosine transposase
VWHRPPGLCWFEEKLVAVSPRQLVAYYERNLPHWHPEGAPVFLTWRLHGTYAKYRRDRNSELSGRTFIEIDRELDKASTGPKWLTDPRIAELVVNALNFGERHLKYYSLIAHVIMPNHVHVLLTPKTPVSKITKSIKGYTATEANKILNRTGQPFWQDESYDHWVRNRYELGKIVRYIESNPVSAGLTDSIEAWPWSRSRTKPNTGQEACATRTQ